MLLPCLPATAATVNSAAGTLGCMYLFKLEFFFFSGLSPGVELLGYLVAFCKTPTLFSTVAAPVYIAANKGVLFLVHFLGNAYLAHRTQTLCLTGNLSSPFVRPSAQILTGLLS